MDEIILIGSPRGNRPRPGLLLVRAAALLLTVLLAAAAFWSLRVAQADLIYREGTPESSARASELVPENARYLANRSEFGSAERAKDLEAAVALNPFFSAAWIELGLTAEAEGDEANAERFLREAARVDNTFTPRWTLANFYFRRGHEEQFWDWARKALEVTAGDASALFRLCWLFKPEPDLILERVVSDEPSRLVRYLLFLLKENRLAVAAPVANRLIPIEGGAHRSVLLNLCERLIAANEPGLALEIWNNLITHRLLPYDPLAPERGASLTNGEFGEAPLARGFDWRLITNEGVVVNPVRRSPGLRLSFSGRQADRCELLYQYVPVLADSRYRLEFTYTATGIPPDSGLRWQFRDQPGRNDTVPQRQFESRPSGGVEAIELRTGKSAKLARLTLRYDRSPGTVPIEGELTLGSVRLKRLDPAPRAPGG